MLLTTTASREAAQMITTATSAWKLAREAPTASLVLRTRTRPERPKDNLRERT